MRALAGLAAALLAGGCMGSGGVSTARTLDPGQHQVVAGLELGGAAVGYRRGLARGVEIDGKLTGLPAGEILTTAGLELSGKVQLYRGQRLELATGAGAGYWLIRSSGATWEAATVQIPLLVGVNLRGGRDQLVIGPRLGVQRWYSSGAMTVNLPFAGATVGYAWTANPRLTVFPEIGIMRSSVDLADVRPARLFHLGIAFLFGHAD
jgi:hypothetical protein